MKQHLTKGLPQPLSLADSRFMRTLLEGVRKKRELATLRSPFEKNKNELREKADAQKVRFQDGKALQKAKQANDSRTETRRLQSGGSSTTGRN